MDVITKTALACADLGFDVETLRHGRRTVLWIRDPGPGVVALSVLDIQQPETVSGIGTACALAFRLWHRDKSSRSHRTTLAAFRRIPRNDHVRIGGYVFRQSVLSAALAPLKGKRGNRKLTLGLSWEFLLFTGVGGRSVGGGFPVLVIRARGFGAAVAPVDPGIADVQGAPRLDWKPRSKS